MNTGTQNYLGGGMGLGRYFSKYIAKDWVSAVLFLPYLASAASLSVVVVFVRKKLDPYWKLIIDFRTGSLLWSFRV